MSDVSRINAINQVESVIGDHKIVVITIQDVKAAPETRYGRDWRKYSKEKLLEELTKIRFEFDIADVQGMWNSM